VEDRVRAWLEAAGLRCRELAQTAPRKRELILVGTPKDAGPEQWRNLTRRMLRGCSVVFLSPEAFRLGDDPTHWIPLERKGCIAHHPDWLYHKESVAKRHAVFEGLQSGGIMDWEHYDQVISQELYEPEVAPDEVIAAAFAPGHWPSGYFSGLHVCSYTRGAGRCVVNTLNILQELDRNPAADRLLVNLVRYGQRDLRQPLMPLPEGVEAYLECAGPRDE